MVSTHLPVEPLDTRPLLLSHAGRDDQLLTLEDVLQLAQVVDVVDLAAKLEAGERREVQGV